MTKTVPEFSGTFCLWGDGMFSFTERSAALLGEAAMEKLCHATVAVVGLGGVGGACAEALVRGGVGRLILMDHDRVSLSNVNRQLFATAHTVGALKTQAAADRLRSVNPAVSLECLPLFYGADTEEILFAKAPDFVADCIDTVTAKVALIRACKERNIPIVSSMGTGNRLDPTAFRLGDIADTAGCGCGLARVMRRTLRAAGIERLPVVYSTELPKPVIAETEGGRHSPASSSFCPPAAGYALASYVIRNLIA